MRINQIDPSDAPEEVKVVASCIMATINAISDFGGAVTVRTLRETVADHMTEPQADEMLRQFTTLGLLSERNGLYILINTDPNEKYAFGFDVNKILNSK